MSLKFYQVLISILQIADAITKKAVYWVSPKLSYWIRKGILKTLHMVMAKGCYLRNRYLLTHRRVFNDWMVDLLYIQQDLENVEASYARA